MPAPDRNVIFSAGATIPPYVAAGVNAPMAPPETPGVAPAERAAPPSTYAVQATLEGQNGAALRLLGLTALRSIFIAPGLWMGAKLSGAQVAPHQLVIISLTSSLTISAGMLGWYALQGALRRRT